MLAFKLNHISKQGPGLRIEINDEVDNMRANNDQEKVEVLNDFAFTVEDTAYEMITTDRTENISWNVNEQFSLQPDYQNSKFAVLLSFNCRTKLTKLTQTCVLWYKGTDG